MQDLEYAQVYITALSIDMRVHDAALPEMNMLGSYPECEGANYIQYYKSKVDMSPNLHTILDTTVSISVK
jgi:ribosome-binding factor A